jgi:hypothetical protein
MAVADHNEFVSRVIMAHGRDLIEMGDLPAQLVALESIVAGLLSVIMRHSGKSTDDAGVYLSSVTHGVRDRLPTLID